MTSPTNLRSGGLVDRMQQELAHLGRLARRATSVVLPLVTCLAAACSSGGSENGVVGPGASDPGGLSVTPPDPFISAGISGGQFFPVSKTYRVQNIGGSTLDWSVGSNDLGLIFLPEAGTLASGQFIDVTIYLDTGYIVHLPPGEFTIFCDFKNETNGAGDESLPVSLSVFADGELDVSPSIGFDATGPVGGPFTPSFSSFGLTNNGTTDLDWEVSTNQNWLVPSTSGGNLIAGASANLTVAIDESLVNGFGPGSYLGVVNVRKAGEAGVDLLVSLEVESPAALFVAPFDGLSQTGPPGGPFLPEGKTYTLTNGGDAPLPWTASSPNGLVSFSVSSGTLQPGASVQVFCSANEGSTSSLGAGNYGDEIFFTNTAGDNLGTTSRLFDLSIATDPAELVVNPGSSLFASGPEGGPFAGSSLTYTLDNVGGEPLDFTVDPSDNWIFASPQSGTLAPGGSTQVTVSINAAVAGAFGSGNYSGSVAFDPSTGSTINRSVTLSVSSGPVPNDGTPLVEGPGWSGSTPQPPGYGSGPASGFKAIAKFDCVPWQEFTGLFPIGVVAFHHRGIDRVEFSANGGPWVSVQTPTLNPRTGVVEYWVNLDSGAPGSASNREIEVRAVVYPVAGVPRVIVHGVQHARPNGPSGVTRYASPSGSDSSGNGTLGNPYRTIAKAASAVAQAQGGNVNHGVVKLLAGSYDWTPNGFGTQNNYGGWLTVQPADGVPRADVVIADGVNGGIRVKCVRAKNLTIRDQLYSTGDGSRLWLDECENFDNSPQTPMNVGWSVGMDKTFWTNGIVRNARWGPMVGFCRGMTIRNIGEDVFSGANPVINCSVDNVDRGSQTSWHPDLFKHHGNYENVIYYGVHATDVRAQGLFWKWSNGQPYRSNYAIINVLIEGLGAYKSQVDIPFEHMVMRGSTIMQTFVWRSVGQGHHCFEGNLFKQMSVSNSTNSQYGSGTVSNVQSNGTFDHNHYINTSNAVTIGSNLTTGSINFVNEAGDDYRPLPGQGLARAPLFVPCDVEGVNRTPPMTVGAFEE